MAPKCGDTRCHPRGGRGGSAGGGNPSSCKPVFSLKIPKSQHAWARQLVISHRKGLGKGLRGKAFKHKLFTAPVLVGNRSAGTSQGAEAPSRAQRWVRPPDILDVLIL